MKKKSAVTKITIGRLYNLGNYEHIRYEISAEVPPGGSAKQTLLDTLMILRGLKPLKKPFGLETAKANLAKIEAERTEQEKAHLSEHRETVQDWEIAKSARAEALAKLDDVAGTSVHTDAKDKWDDYDDAPAIF